MNITGLHCRSKHMSITSDVDQGNRAFYMQIQALLHLKKLSFSATTVNPVAWERSRVLLLTRLPVFSRYST